MIEDFDEKFSREFVEREIRERILVIYNESNTKPRSRASHCGHNAPSTIFTLDEEA